MNLFRMGTGIGAAVTCMLLSGGYSQAQGFCLSPGEPTVTVEKVAVADCRAVRGFLGTPVDGSVVSWGYRGAVCEYPDTGIEGYDAGAGVDYSFNGNDGLHLTFADAGGFDMVVLRGGAKARLYGNNTGLIEPSDGKALYEFNDSGITQTVRFPRRVDAQKASFFGVRDGAIADVGFYRIHPAEAAGHAPQMRYLSSSPAQLPEPSSKFAPESILPALPERYPGKEGALFEISETAPRGVRLPCRADVPVHFISSPGEGRSGLDALRFDLEVSDAPGSFTMTAVVQDPLDPRLDLVWVDVSCSGNGRYRFRLDFPDQVLFATSRLWLTLIFDSDVTLSGPDGAAPLLQVETIPVARALPEAVQYRKLLLKSFFVILSESRPWGRYQKQSREEFYNIYQYSALCPELFLTLDICHDFAPEDDMVRQYRDWVYLRNLDRLSDVSPPPGPPSGVPAWAWYMRMGWLETRRIAQWWLDERLVPTGEFGGMVGDDTDLYQQFTDLPNFENDGVGARVRDGAARLAELADKENLRGGINILTTDALHAYEEGMNHLALMSRWFYGDPVYYERCLESAANMERLTVKTPDGRRHIPHSRDLGYGDIEQPKPPTVEGSSTPLLWHPALQAVEYNRNPRALALLREWADTWLRYQKPGQWATEIDVQSGEVKASDKNRPLSGRAQDLTFTWLYRLTGDSKYIEPFLHFYRQGEAPQPSHEFLNDLHNLGALDALDRVVLEKLGTRNPALHCLLTGDASRMVEAVIGPPRPGGASINNLYDARRWPDMYTESHLYDDRVFLGIARYPSIAYLGGYSYRNRYLPANAVSWEGFGTDYAALVTVNRLDRLEVLLYNFSEAPLHGTMRVWALRHGTYRIETGIDTDRDNTMDSDITASDRELSRADGVPVTIAPKTVTAVRVTQISQLDDITVRPDLALAAREITVRGNRVSGVVHNIGSTDAHEVVVALTDARGKVLDRKSLGSLAAPNDLLAKRVSFELTLPSNAGHGWKVAVDPGNLVPEIFEGNNTVRSQDLPAGAAGRE